MNVNITEFYQEEASKINTPVHVPEQEYLKRDENESESQWHLLAIDVTIHLAKTWNALDRLSIIWKSDLLDKIQ